MTAAILGTTSGCEGVSSEETSFDRDWLMTVLVMAGTLAKSAMVGGISKFEEVG